MKFFSLLFFITFTTLSYAEQKVLIGKELLSRSEERAKAECAKRTQVYEQMLTQEQKNDGLSIISDVEVWIHIDNPVVLGHECSIWVINSGGSGKFLHKEKLKVKANSCKDTLNELYENPSFVATREVKIKKGFFSRKRVCKIKYISFE